MPAEEILVTGAAGWIGSRTCARLRSDGYDVVGPPRAEIDWSNRSQASRVIADLRPATIVHLAASLPRRSGDDEGEIQWRDTLLSGRNVIEAASSAGVSHVLVAGSMEELGNSSGTLPVDLPGRPHTPYGLCKSLLRDLAGFTARKWPMRIDWFRPTTVYGPGQTGPMLIPTACRAAMSGEPAKFTDGSQRRDFLFVDDLVGWIAFAVGSRPRPTGDVAVHHIGTGDGVRVAEVLGLIAEVLPDARFELGAIPHREGEPAVQVAPRVPTADPQLSGWRAQTGWRKGIRQTADWWMEGRS